MSDREKKGMISIIIPVYNSGSCLKGCLESIINQSYPEIEVLIVDDGSSDGSLELARKYEREFSFIHAYKKKNEGVSAARNYGLQRAKGQFVQFVDSDDKLESEACQKLVQCMEQTDSDVVIAGYWNERESLAVLPPKQHFESKADFMTCFPALFSRFFIHVPWNKLYRRELLSEVSFPIDLNKGEDLLFNLQVLSRAQRVGLLDENIYFYHNINENSLSFRFREDAMEIEERLFYAVEQFYSQQCPKQQPKFVYQYYLTAVKNKFYALLKKSDFGKTECKRQIKNWIQMKSIQELTKRMMWFGKKDRILLILMKCHAVSILYWYYRRQGGETR